MEHTTHSNHSHIHGKSCGHTAIQHLDHIDYIHDGHLHKIHGDHVDECKIEITKDNPDTCTSGHSCNAHDVGHVHGDNCGHEKVPHGDHYDYLVDGHLHHPHNNHCDNHGKVLIAS